MLHRTPSGCCEKDIGSSKAHIPQRCKHGETYFYTRQLVRSNTKKRSAPQESKAERLARLHFNRVVRGWPCFFRLPRAGRRDCERCKGNGVLDQFGNDGSFVGPVPCPSCDGTSKHHCFPGPKDAHHLIEKQFIRRNYADLPEDELLEILFAPVIGAPLCRTAHEVIKTHKIFWHELTQECKDFCAGVDARYLEVLSPAGLKRTSMVERLRLECPERAEAVRG